MLKPVEEGFELDFGLTAADGRRLNVEVDGHHHVDRDGRQRRRDLERDRVLRGLGWEVVRIPAWRCLAEPADVAQAIAAVLEPAIVESTE